MRSPAPLASLLVVASLLAAGCTTDGYLGEIDDGENASRGGTPGTPGTAPRSALWRDAAPSHEADVSIQGARLSIDGGLAPLELPSVTLRTPGPVPPFDTSPAPTHFALAGAVHEGERGWIVVSAAGEPALEADAEDPIVLREHALRGHGASLSARVAGDMFVVARPIGPCFGFGHETPECQAWREAQPPARPSAYENASEVSFTAVDLPAEITVRGSGLEFHGANGSRRAPGPEARVSTANASLVALFAGPGAPLLGVELDVPLAAAPALDGAAGGWTGNLSVRATPVSGEIAFADRTEILAVYNDAAIKIRGGGPARLELAGQEWRFAQQDAELVDVTTAGTPRLGATLRLAPEIIEAAGPAGNVTQVKLILAETSGGADAHLAGYRIDETVNARYVGDEPFYVTEALWDLLNETSGTPIEPAMLFAVGVSMPFFAILDGIAGIVHALFPPSVAGTLGAGEGKVLTFELQMPDAARDVDILIESRNAEPVRATIRMLPTS